MQRPRLSRSTHQSPAKEGWILTGTMDLNDYRRCEHVVEVRSRSIYGALVSPAGYPCMISSTTESRGVRLGLHAWAQHRGAASISIMPRSTMKHSTSLDRDPLLSHVFNSRLCLYRPYLGGRLDHPPFLLVEGIKLEFYPPSRLEIPFRAAPMHEGRGSRKRAVSEAR